MEYKQPTSAPPCETIYIRSINERIKKNEIKRSLYELCSQFGTVIKVYIRKKFKLRGQAFVAFDNAESATLALQNLEGFVFFGKPIRVEFAKSQSRVLHNYNGDGNERPKKRQRIGDAGMSNARSMKPFQAPSVAAAVQVPNHILLVENLPKETTQEMLNTLFSREHGFTEARLVNSRPGIAFVEFDSESSAGSAINNLQGFKFTETNILNLSYAKK